jgi:surface protein
MLVPLMEILVDEKGGTCGVGKRGKGKGKGKGKDANMQSFNDDISRWDTSNVTTMIILY